MNSDASGPKVSFSESTSNVSCIPKKYFVSELIQIWKYQIHIIPLNQTQAYWKVCERPSSFICALTSFIIYGNDFEPIPLSRLAISFVLDVR
jgi:hypothetical protein